MITGGALTAVGAPLTAYGSTRIPTGCFTSAHTSKETQVVVTPTSVGFQASF